MTPLKELAKRVEAARTPSSYGSKLSFRLCKGEGWVICGDEPTVILLCDMWNARKEIAAALRAWDAMGEQK